MAMLLIGAAWRLLLTAGGLLPLKCRRSEERDLRYLCLLPTAPEGSNWREIPLVSSPYDNMSPLLRMSRL